MKKICILLITSLVLFASCVSTSSIYGDNEPTFSNHVSVYNDKFAQTKTYESTDGLRGGFALSSGFSTDYLHVYPHIVVFDNVAVPYLEIEYTGSKTTLTGTGADKNYSKFIFLGNNERLTIIPNVYADKNADIDVDIVGGKIYDTTKYETSYGMRITKSQFEQLRDFFSNKDVIECAAYSTDNKVVEFETYNKKWHKECFSYLISTVERENRNVVWNENITDVVIK